MNQKITLEDGIEAEVISSYEVFKNPNAFEIFDERGRPVKVPSNYQKQTGPMPPQLIVARKIKTRHDKIREVLHSGLGNHPGIVLGMSLNGVVADAMATEIEKALDA